MITINENFIKIPQTYLFSEISRRINKHKEDNPKEEIISMGIGDVSLPLPKAAVGALIKAVKEQEDPATFRGYGPELGYDFLREAIVENDYRAHGIAIGKEEVFISDGAKSDTANIVDVFAVNNRVAIIDPAYPVYVDTNAMYGRAGEPNEKGEWSNLLYLRCKEENNFVPDLPQEPVDMIYLCYPNNPTGIALTKDQMKQWVDYAIANKSIILFDAAYEAFVTEHNVPHSIYEIEGAEEVAIEFRSFSKKAGFTGTRCAYTVVPKSLQAYTEKGEKVGLTELWNRRQSTKFNGVSYMVQRAAEAIYSEEGKEEVKALIAYYLENARIIREAMKKVGNKVFGGVNSPYVWVKAPNNMGSWEYFDYLLNDKNIICTPGVGFGQSGAGYVRFSALGTKENTEIAMKRLGL